MAHGFLTPSPVTGESPLWKDLKKGFENLLKKKIFPLSKQQKVIETKVDVIQNLLKQGEQKKLPPAATKMLTGNQPKGLLAPSGGLVNRNGGLTEKNPTNIDVKTGKKLPPGGPRLPGTAKKGGTFSNINTSNRPLNSDNFFDKAVKSGIDANTGDYLSKDARIAAFKEGRVERNSQGPAITPDSGADIVAAVNRNTQALVQLVDVTKEQTKNDSNIAQEQIQAQETMLSRSAARAEEKSLEQGSDLSGFLSPEKIKRKQKQQGGGSGGGGGDGFDAIGTALDAYDLFGGRRGRRGGRRPKTRFKAPRPKGTIPKVRPGGGIPKGGLLPKGGPKLGLPKGLGPKGGALSLLFAGMEFGDRKASGQSNLQAGVGTAASVGGGLAGAKGGAAAGAAIGALFGGVGAVPGAIIGGLLGGIGGSMLGGGIADAATGANDAGSFSMGGIITKPLLSLMGEGHKKEGVFPLEGKEGAKVFGKMGEGLVEAQVKAKKKFAEVQSFALKTYFENQDGFKMFGKALEIVFGPLINGIKGIGGLLKAGGGLLNSLMGGSANAAQFASADEQQLTEALIAGEEGLRTKAYKDSEGIWTIGYGQTTLNGRAVQEGDTMSKEEALSGFRANVASHRQRAINQLGEDRWGKLDPRSRAVLTSLAYNYGSIPDRILPAAKTGSAEDIAKAMNSLYGDNNGDLKGRRMREQSILRGGTSDRLDQDFMAGGSLAATTSGPMVMSASAGSRAEGTGLATFGETDGGSGRLVNAAGYVHGHFQTNTGTKQDVVNDTAAVVRSMLNSGLTDISISDGTTFTPAMSDGEIKGIIERGVAQHTHSGDGRSVDIFVPRGTPVPFPLTDVRNAGNAGRTGMLPGTGHTWVGHLTPDSQAGANQSASAHIAAEPDAGGGGPMTQNGSTAGPMTNAQKAQIFRSAGLTGMADMISPPAVSAQPASPATATPLMATSAQIAMQPSLGSAAPTVINNYYGAGGTQQQGVNPNGVSAGISMDGTGTSIFQDLKIRTLS